MTTLREGRSPWEPGPEVAVCFDPQELESLPPDTRVVLVPRAEDAGWLNLRRPLFAERRLRTFLWMDAALYQHYRRTAVDFMDWVSHRIDLPPTPPDFAVQGLQEAWAAGAWVRWRGPGLDEALAAALPGVPVHRVAGSDRYDRMVSAARQGLMVVDRPRVAAEVWRARIAWSEARSRRAVILVEPGCETPGAWALHGSPKPWEAAGRALSQWEPSRRGVVAAWMDLEPEALSLAGDPQTAPHLEAAPEALARAELGGPWLRAGWCAPTTRRLLGRLRRAGRADAEDEAARWIAAEGDGEWEGEARADVWVSLCRKARGRTLDVAAAAAALKTGQLSAAARWGRRVEGGGTVAVEALIQSGREAEALRVARRQLNKAKNDSSLERAVAMLSWAHALEPVGRAQEAEEVLQKALGLVAPIKADDLVLMAYRLRLALLLMLARAQQANLQYELAMATLLEASRSLEQLEEAITSNITQETKATSQTAKAPRTPRPAEPLALLAPWRFNPELIGHQSLVGRSRNAMLDTQLLHLQFLLALSRFELGTPAPMEMWSDLIANLELHLQLLPEDPDVASWYAWACLELTALHLDLDGPSEAQELLSRAQPRIRTARDTNPERVNLLLEELTLEERRVGVLTTLGNPKQARGHATWILAEIRAALATRPGWRGMSRLEAGCLGKLGDIERDLGRPRRAYRRYQAAIARIMREDASILTVSDWRSISALLDRLADVQSRYGDLLGALSSLQESARIMHALVSEHPTVLALRNDWVRVQLNLVDYFVRRSDHANARRYLALLLDESERLLGERSGFTPNLYWLASACERAATLYPQNARTWLDRAIAHYRSCADQMPSHVHYRNVLAALLVTTGRRLSDEAAPANLEEGLRLLRALQQEGLLEEKFAPLLDPPAPTPS